ncbi:MAG: winged helix-turn-helix domain-containing protein [Vulcanimicrobiaceae bacterium]
MVRVSLRLKFDGDRLIGPGRVRLLELIAETGSISAAGREMAMSYRRAWLLIDDLNRSFKKPLVEKQLGGVGGGGAMLTPLGAEVVRRYRTIEARIALDSRADINALERALA